MEPVYEPGTNVIPPERPKTPISLQDLLNDVAVLKSNEALHKDALLSLQNLSTQYLKEKLLVWAGQQFPNAFVFHTLPVKAPTKCSDGISRGLAEYVTFVSGNNMQTLLLPLQERLSDFSVSFATTGDEIVLVISKP